MCIYVPFLVLMAGHLGGSVFFDFHRLGVSEQALGGVPLGFGFLWKINLSCIRPFSYIVPEFALQLCRHDSYIGQM